MSGSGRRILNALLVVTRPTSGRSPPAVKTCRSNRREGARWGAPPPHTSRPLRPAITGRQIGFQP